MRTHGILNLNCEFMDCDTTLSCRWLLFWWSMLPPSSPPPEYGGSRLPYNNGNHPWDYMVSKLRRSQSKEIIWTWPYVIYVLLINIKSVSLNKLSCRTKIFLLCKCTAAIYNVALGVCPSCYSSLSLHLF